MLANTTTWHFFTSSKTFIVQQFDGILSNLQANYSEINGKSSLVYCGMNPAKQMGR